MSDQCVFNERPMPILYVISLMNDEYDSSNSHDV